MKYEFEVSSDEQVCWKCGKPGRGYYKTQNGNYICPACVKTRNRVRIAVPVRRKQA